MKFTHCSRGIVAILTLIAGLYCSNPTSVKPSDPIIRTLSVENTSVGINDSVHLHAKAKDTYTGAIVSYEWKIGDGSWITTDSGGDTTIIAPSTAQTLVCSLRATDDDGKSVKGAITITVETRAPTADAGNDTTVGINDTVYFNATGADETTVAEYAWKCGNGDWIVVPDGDTSLAAPATAQTWTCSLRVTDDDGNMVYDTKTITIESRIPTADAGNDTTVGINDMVHLKGTGTDETMVTEYAWKCGNGDWIVVDDGDTSLAAPATAQTWTCSLRVTDDDGNMVYDTVAVTVETRAPVADAGTDKTVGINDSYELIGSGSSDEGALVAYAWKIGNGDWSPDNDGDTTLTAPSTAQTLICSLRVMDDDNTFSYDAVTVTVETRAPVADAGTDTLVARGETVHLTGSGSSDETSITEYAWKCGTNNWVVVGDGDTSVVAPTSTTEWECILRVTDDDNNMSYDTASVFVTVIAFDTSSSQRISGDSTFSWEHRIGGESNRVLLIGIGANTVVESSTANIAVSVTYNGVNLTRVANEGELGWGHDADVSLWYALDADLPATGSYTVEVTFDSTIDDGACGGISLYNVAQAAPEAIDSSVIRGQWDNVISTDVTTLTDGAWVIDAVTNKPGFGAYSPLVPTEKGQFERLDVANANGGVAMSTKPVISSGPSTLGWTFDIGHGGWAAQVLAVFAPAAP
ncbi:MAG: PKD domain-containing protein [Chitinivibrionales bacterium]|nr:PKD domain-containing protein [Chitinivibrionales bacterium]